MSDVNPNDREEPSYQQVHRGRVHQLDPGSKLPPIRLQTTAGVTLSLPEQLAGSYNILLFYRGHW